MPPPNRPASPAAGAEHRVTVLANPSCSHCVRALDHVTELCAAAGVAVAGIDLTRYPELAARWAVETSPLVVIDDRIAYAGIPSDETFRALLGLV